MTRPKARYRGKASPVNGASPLDGLERPSKSAVAVGTGFVALDIVIGETQEKSPQTWAGGTCGNVMAILAYLGWKTYPVATLGKDAPAERIIEDLSSFGVDPRFIRLAPERRTPIVIERIRKLSNGIPKSRFIWTCPGCGAWLPGFQPVRRKDMVGVAAAMPDSAVYFFDRVSRGALDLAEAAAKRGALVVFEPSGVRDQRLFREALQISHILKYSHERLSGIGEKLREGSPILEIETLGAEGLRYRVRRESHCRNWRLMEAYDIGKVRDPVGAGDWCTAGVIHILGREGAGGLTNVDEAEVERALRLGQALAALACRHEGARGGMYAMNKTQFRTAIRSIMKGRTPGSRPDQLNTCLDDLWRAFCPSCGLDRHRTGEPRT